MRNARLLLVLMIALIFSAAALAQETPIVARVTFVTGKKPASSYCRAGTFTLWFDGTVIRSGTSADCTTWPEFGPNVVKNAHFVVPGTSTPTLGGCGTGATIAGNDSVGRVTLGSTPGTCVVTFATAWTNAPVCTSYNETQHSATFHRNSAVPGPTLGIVVSSSSDANTPAQNDVISYTCAGY